jgi:Fur family transcriptional regulator, ferric uptake regulator
MAAKHCIAPETRVEGPRSEERRDRRLSAGGSLASRPRLGHSRLSKGPSRVGRQTDRAPAELEHLRGMLNAYMLKKGLRSTDQRRLIVETFFHSDNHVSIEELLARVRATDPRVGYATVYRTLKLLTECGVANERRFGDGLTRYELADDVTHHDHLICVGCGDITEFEEPRIEELQERVARKYGFELRSHKHELYGVCPKCLAKGRGGN